MATFTCPAGHESTTADYCDTCGAPIEASAPGAGAAGSPPSSGATPPASPAAGPASAAAPTGAAAAAPSGATACPSCGDPVSGRFCESCGYDVEKGAPAAPRPVTLVLGADRAHWERMVGDGEPAFPVAVPALTLELSGDRATLGRVRSGAPIDVDLALTGSAADPAVSHRQCSFERDGDSWLVMDLASANGTWINDADEPLADGATHRLAEGDRILMGAWTCLTVHGAPAAPAEAAPSGATTSGAPDPGAAAPGAGLADPAGEAPTSPSSSPGPTAGAGSGAAAPDPPAAPSPPEPS
jgi:FHA domain-containing protein